MWSDDGGEASSEVLAGMPLQEISAKLDTLNQQVQTGSSGHSLPGVSTLPAGYGRTLRMRTDAADATGQNQPRTAPSSLLLSRTGGLPGPANRSASPFRKETQGPSQGIKPQGFGFQEPLGVSIELGMELVRRNRQLEREVRKLNGMPEVGDDSHSSIHQTPSYSSDARLRQAEEMAQDLSSVSRWAEEADRLQRHACRTLLNAVRKESPQGAEVHQALAQLAAFPPPPTVHSRGIGSVSGALPGNYDEDERSRLGALATRDEGDMDANELRLEVSRLRAEVAMMAESRRQAEEQASDGIFEGYIREERKRHVEQMQFMQERLEAAEGVAKELCVKLANVCAVCDGTPAALEKQQAAANAALNEFARSRSTSPVGGGLSVASPSMASRVQLSGSYSCPLLPRMMPAPQDLGLAAVTRSHGTAASRSFSPVATSIANALAAKAQRGRLQTMEESMVVRLPVDGFQSIRGVGELGAGEEYPNSAARDLADTQGAARRPLGVSLSSYHALPPRSQGASQGTPPSNPVDAADIIFNMVDKNSDGNITKEELTNAFRSGLLQQAPPPIMVNGKSMLSDPGLGSTPLPPLTPWTLPSPPNGNRTTAGNRTPSPQSRMREAAASVAPTINAIASAIRGPASQAQVAGGSILPPQAPTMRPLTPETRLRSPLSGFRETASTPQPLLFDRITQVGYK
jgi:hypothetical protein